MNHKKKLPSCSLTLSLLVCLAAVSGTAVSSEQAAASNDALAVQVLAGGCAGCHGTDGQLAGLIPAIAGQPAEVLEAQMLRFKTGDGMATVMNRIAAGYTDDELASLAQYFSEQ